VVSHKDAASQDEDGYVWYEGRADDVIISAGYRIGPFEVESPAWSTRRGRGGRVAWPDERRGNIVRRSSCSRRPRAQRRLGTEISAFVREHLSATPIPVSSSSSTTCPDLTGKIRRIELRERSKAP